MDRRQKESIDAYGRVQAFLADHPLTAPASYGAPQVRLDEAIEQLAAHVVAQSETTRTAGAGSVRIRALCRALRERHLRPVAAIAKAVMRDVPGIEVALRIPAYKLSPARLLAEAKAIRNAVAPHEATLVANGRPADFLAQLDAASQAVHDAAADRGRRKVERTASGKVIREQIRRGRSAVEMLDAIVRTHFEDDPYVLGKWEAARRVVLVPVSTPPALNAVNAPRTVSA